MSNGIYTAMSGAVAQSAALDVVANNVANGATPGFQAQRASFGEVLSTADGSSFVGMVKTTPDTSRGVMTQTGNPLDLALEGDGYFAVDTANGVRYTRAGAFRLNPEGTLVDANGNSVRGVGGSPIVVPPDAEVVNVGADGTLTATTPAEPEAAELGKLEVVRFDAAKLRPEGEAYFRASGEPSTEDPPNVMSGHLEGSNADPVRGMVDLVRISRTYEALHRMIESYRQLDQRTAREVGGAR